MLTRGSVYWAFGQAQSQDAAVFNLEYRSGAARSAATVNRGVEIFFQKSRPNLNVHQPGEIAGAAWLARGTGDWFERVVLRTPVCGHADLIFTTRPRVSIDLHERPRTTKARRA